MYILNLGESSRKLIEKFYNLSFEEKIIFIKYVLERFNNNQINDLNEVNPLVLDDSIDIKIFNPISIGCDNYIISKIIEYINFKTKIYHFYQKENNKLLSLFERLNFKEKIDVVIEIILFLETSDLLPNYMDGYLIAKDMLRIKN